jgi:hypothetical protein
MTLCPIALAVGCRKCFAFEACPLKAVIGDYKPEGSGTASPPAAEAKRDEKPKDAR